MKSSSCPTCKDGTVCQELFLKFYSLATEFQLRHRVNWLKKHTQEAKFSPEHSLFHPEIPPRLQPPPASLLKKHPMTDYNRLENILQFKVRGTIKLPHIAAEPQPSRSGSDHQPLQESKMVRCLHSEKGRTKNT